MKKTCIFCGKNPISKNKEHIIPKWLIELTGDPKRTAIFGIKEGKELKFSWSNYVFPSCTSCNSDFSETEGLVKSTVAALLADKPISHADMNLLMDWMDKVRIGVWLGQAQLKKQELLPNFYIKQRVGEKDRLCILYKIDDTKKGIGVIGTETPLFKYIPSCFGLVINNIVLFNYSKEFILSKNLGFPHPTLYEYFTNGKILVKKLNYGTSKVTFPLLEGSVIKPSIKFYQSIIRADHGLKRPQYGPSKKYIQSNSMSFQKKLIQSRVYVSDEFQNDTGYWQKGKKKSFTFPKRFDRNVLGLGLAKMVFEHQNLSTEQMINRITNHSEQEKLRFIKLYRELVKINYSYLEEVNKALNPITRRI